MCRIGDLSVALKFAQHSSGLGPTATLLAVVHEFLLPIIATDRHTIWCVRSV